MKFTPRARVLCVDDDEDTRLMLGALLKFSLIEAHTSPTAAHALSLIEVEHFDLYLLDAWLPDMDGFVLCRKLRDFDPDKPILFFSGAAREADKKKGIEAGATDYVTKPDINQLIGRVTELVAHTAKPTARIIPFMTRTSFETPFSLELAIA